MRQIVIEQSETGSAATPVLATPSPARPKFYLVGENERPSPPAREATAVGSRSSKFVCINGSWQAVRGRTISFEQIIAFVSPGQLPAALRNTTVSYRRGPSARPTGLLQPGDAIPLVEGMLINAGETVAS